MSGAATRTAPPLSSQRQFRLRETVSRTGAGRPTHPPRTFLVNRSVCHPRPASVAVAREERRKGNPRRPRQDGAERRERALRDQKPLNTAPDLSIRMRTTLTAVAVSLSSRWPTYPPEAFSSSINESRALTEAALSLKTAWTGSAIRPPCGP